MALTRILVPTDFSETAEEALDYGLNLARSFDAELHLLHATVLHAEGPSHPLTYLPSLDDLLDRADEAARSEMAALLEAHPQPSLRIHEAVRRGFTAAQVILDYCNEKQPDLVVLGTHGRRGWRRWVLGSVTEEVLRQATCPVVTLRTHSGKGHETASSLLLATDFSPSSKPVIVLAAELAKKWDATLHLVHVVEEIVWPDVYSSGAITALTAQREAFETKSAESLSRTMEELRSMGDPISLRSHVKYGRPDTEILATAEAVDADLILVGRHGLSAFERLLLGSTTERLVRRSDRPILAVPCPEC